VPDALESLRGDIEAEVGAHQESQDEMLSSRVPKMSSTTRAGFDSVVSSLGALFGMEPKGEADAARLVEAGRDAIEAAVKEKVLGPHLAFDSLGPRSTESDVLQALGRLKVATESLEFQRWLSDDSTQQQPATA